ncbi:MAG: dephospho-CoA kinase [Desulfobacteraceae bacterium]|nr:dephospho-CoA kinase [Desulfobacteraceae bacterium]
MSIFKIAVTGSAGSGKSLVCSCFAELGLKTIDCDQIAREVVKPGMQAYNDIVDFFGREILLSDDSLDRLKLRKIISSNEKMRHGLEDIMHPAILNSLFLKIKKAQAEGKNSVIVEIPLLFELNLTDKFDFIITVAGKEDDLVERIIKRDNVSKKDAQDILTIQLSQKEKVERSDFVIRNTSGINELEASVDMLYQKIKKEYLT